MRGWAQATTNANGLNMPIGFQSYVFREEISQKPQETMGRLVQPQRIPGTLHAAGQILRQGTEEDHQRLRPGNRQLPLHLERDHG